MIYHIEEINRIREVEKQTRQKNGKPVFDLSNWNSGLNYKDYLYQYLKFPVINDYFDYIYGYEVESDIHQQVKEKLNVNIPSNASIFFPSSTISIVNIANFLQKMKLRKICILQPSYFSVEPCLSSFGLNVYNEELIYNNDQFSIPINTILEKNYDAVWLTSPIFCTNLIFSENEMQKLNQLLKNKIFLICDESLAPYHTQLRSRLINNEFLLSIYSPHKVLGTNTIKFSCVIAHQIYEDFFDAWSDLFAGGMSLSSKIAIMHFLSNNYEYTLQKGMDYINQNYEAVKELLQKYQHICSYTKVSGIYVTVIVKNIPYEITTKHHFIKSIIERTNVSFLPGYLEGFLEGFGFCFRINMTLDKTPLLISLNKVLMYLETNFL